MSATSPYRLYLNRRLGTVQARTRFYRRLARKVRSMTQLRAVLDAAPDPRVMLDGLKPFLRIES